MMPTHKKALLTLLLAALLCLTACGFTACGNSAEESTPVSDSGEGGESVEQTEALTDIAFAGETPFRLVYNVDVPESERGDILSIRDAVEEATGKKLVPLDDFAPDEAAPFELIVNSHRREECAALTDTLADGEYAIKAVVTEEKTSIVIAYRGDFARIMAISHFIDEYVTRGGCVVPGNLDFRSNTDAGESIAFAGEKPNQFTGENQFRLVYNVDVDTAERDDILSIRTAVKEATGGVTLAPLDDFAPEDEAQFELIVNSDRRKESAALKSTLKDGEYAFRALRMGDKTSIIIAYKGDYARMCAIERFIDEFVENGGCAVPGNLNIKEEVKVPLIESDIECLRDPCVIYDDGVYYAYGTGWNCYYNDTGALDKGWKGPLSVVEMPKGHESEGGCHWAPEVHKVGDSFYMFTTYLSNKTNHRGCTILKADNPKGPFVEITDGHITPKNWDSIDGTLYIDTDGQPWMVFVHEWTSTPDKVGTMAAAKLSEDFTHFISEPVELFRADAPKWSKNNVTDGCWMYRTEAGSLLMIWSNWDSAGYCVGIARSETGLVEGPWIQEEALLYSKALGAQYDGGHGMIFTHTDGQMYLAIHSPNNSSAGRPEKPVFVPIKEENDTLVWDR